MGMGSGKGKAPKTAEEKAKAVADRKAKIDSAKAAMVERNKVRASKAETKAATKPAGGMGRGLADLGKKPPYKPGEGGRGLPPKPTGGMTAQEAKAKAAAARRPSAAEKIAASRKPVGSAASGMGAAPGMKSGGSCKKYARGGGIEVRGKTKGRII